MTVKLRIWRVVPTSKTGVQAPSFFVETTKKNREESELEAIKLARTSSRLGNFPEWNFNLTKMCVRKDKFGRYIKNHQ